MMPKHAVYGGSSLGFEIRSVYTKYFVNICLFNIDLNHILSKSIDYSGGTKVAWKQDNKANVLF